MSASQVRPRHLVRFVVACSRCMLWMVLLFAMTFRPYVNAQPPRSSPVVITPVVQREVASGRTFVGTILPVREATIGTAVDGRVVEVLFEEGDRVKARQPLVKLLTDTVSLEFEAAQAELDFRQQQLAELENGSRPEEVQRAQARLLAAEARMNYLLSRRQRTQTLFDNGSAVSKENLDEAISASVAAEQDYQEAKASYDLAVAGPRKEQIAQARAQVRMQQALVHKLGDQIKKHTIVSRFDGYVTAKLTELGQWVTKGDPVVAVVALDPVEVNTYVPEAQVPYVVVGKEVRVEVPSLADRFFTGRVALVIPAADARARTFPVKVRVDNPATENGPPLKSGMTARVTLPTGAVREALLVPKDALVLGGPAPLVYVVDIDPATGDRGKVRPVVVELGVASGRSIQVVGALQSGEQVVVRGNERLRPGQEVKVLDELAAEASVRVPDMPPHPPLR